MSSEDDAAIPGPGQAPSKRTRMHGACDLCRQKKIRCDSAKRPGMKCSNCVNCGSECTHVHANQKAQGPRIARPSPPESLTLGQLRDSLNPILTSILVPTYQAPSNAAIVRDTVIKLAQYARALEAVVPAKALHSKAPVLPPSNIPERATPVSKTWNDSMKPVDDEDVINLSEQFGRSLCFKKGRFFGPSSNINFIRSALADSGRFSEPEKCISTTMKGMRATFWATLPWETPPPHEDPRFDFPEPDLLEKLTDLFFTHSNIYGPVLHRPTVEKGIKAGLHHTDAGFAGVVLGLSAVASRYSVDERVLLEGTSSTHSCGYKWFRQIKQFHESSLRPPTLHELQALWLSVSYLKGSSTPEKAWYLVGFGIRAAYDIGLHQGKEVETESAIERELRKRLFWILMMDEMQMTIMAGRPAAVNVESDIDLEAPLLVDDEYWENPDPKLAFKQPPGKPSKVSFFNSYISLIKIHFASHQFLNATKRPEPPQGLSRKEWDRMKLAEIDSALNAWVDAVPPHLRWDGLRSSESDPVFYDQSALLFTLFYYIQILVHRPFIGSQDEPALAFSSLAICTNAARACIRIMVTQSRNGFVPTPQIVFALFGSGLILLLGMWRQQRTGCEVLDDHKDTGALRSSIDLLEMYESRWHCAGKFRDILMALCQVGSVSLEPAKAVKRSHNQLENGEDDQSRRNTRRKSQAMDFKHDPSEELTVMPSPTSGSSLGGSPPSDDKNPFQFPFYSSELCKPFSQFAPSGSVDSNALEQQLDALEAMLGDISQFTTTSGLGSNDVILGRGQVIPGFPDAPAGSAVDFLTGSPSSLPTVSSAANFGLGPLNYPVSDVQTASMWTGVPSGHEWGDWNNYITNLEALTGPQFLPSPVGTPYVSISDPPAQPQAMGHVW